jgi:hypothetical protein
MVDTVDTVKIIFNKCASFSGLAKFDVSLCPKGECVVVNGECVDGGWVFCGTERDPDNPSFAMLHGEYLQVYGGTFELLKDDDGEGWSGDVGTGRFSITHDGESAEILVIYGTRAD